MSGTMVGGRVCEYQESSGGFFFFFGISGGILFVVM